MIDLKFVNPKESNNRKTFNNEMGLTKELQQHEEKNFNNKHRYNHDEIVTLCLWRLPVVRIKIQVDITRIYCIRYIYYVGTY